MANFAFSIWHVIVIMLLYSAASGVVDGIMGPIKHPFVFAAFDLLLAAAIILLARRHGVEI